MWHCLDQIMLVISKMWNKLLIIFFLLWLQQIISCHDNGTVEIFNRNNITSNKSKSSSNSILLEPWKNSQVARPEFGRAIFACVAINSSDKCSTDLAILGGGPQLSLWHLSSGKLLHIFQSPGIYSVVNGKYEFNLNPEKIFQLDVPILLETGSIPLQVIFLNFIFYRFNICCTYD